MPAPDRVLRDFQRSPRELAAALATVDMSGQWLATGARSTLSVSLGFESVLERPGWIHRCDRALEVDATVRSSDGVMDATVRAELVALDDDVVVLSAPSLPALPSMYTGPAVNAQDARDVDDWLSTVELVGPDDSLTLQTEYQLATSPLHAIAVIGDLEQIAGVWSTDGSSPVPAPPDPATSDAELASAHVNRARNPQGPADR